MSNRVIQSKETNIILNMTMFCEEEEPKKFEIPNE